MANGELLYITDSSGASKRAGSLNEYNLALALEAEEIQFLFQFQIHGGHRSLGGIAVDFVVWIPFIVPLEVIGKYWHQNSTRERFRSSLITSYFGREPIEFTEEETENVTNARSAVKNKLK